MVESGRIIITRIIGCTQERDIIIMRLADSWRSMQDRRIMVIGGISMRRAGKKVWVRFVRV
jgi:hypothetical protein